MARRIFVLVPSLCSTGPVKGAVALANALAAHRDVTLVALKRGSGAEADIDQRVSLVSLESQGAWPARMRAYRSLLEDAGGRTHSASISFCFSADMVNRWCRSAAVTCATVRGNLSVNYRMDYGLPGVALAFGHLSCLKGFDAIVAMTDAMAAQVRSYTGVDPAVIGNFVDEHQLERYRNTAPRQGPPRFVFLGSLSERKQPLLFVEALAQLHQAGHPVSADIIGDGPLRTQVARRVAGLELGACVRVHGALENPFTLLAAADVMVLPSLSEGLSRAALEALYLGVPCVLRAVDGNRELIREGVNGALFTDPHLLAAVMARTADWSRPRPRDESLLPLACRQAEGVRRYLALLDNQS